ncbi:MAG: phage integrase SAM-like domain-containing protein [Prevotella sp.]|nr:phage integrase SAM-like domain-containing protein [Prevotella sp.]
MAHTFNLRTSKKHGEGTLYTMVKANGTTMRINTGIMVDIAKWNGNREAYLIEDAANNNGMSITAKMGKASNIIDAMIKQGCKDGKEIASAIQDVTDIDAQRAEAAIRETKRGTLLGYLVDFIDRAEKGIATAKNGSPLKDETIKQYKVVRAALSEFFSASKEYGASTTFSDIDRRFAETLLHYWADSGILPSSINRYQGCIRAICNRASEEGINRNGASLKIWHQLDDEDGKKTEYALTEKELDALYNLPLTGKDAICRDIFMVGCLTGQRHSDYSRINKSMLHQINGIDMIILKQKKTGETVYIPIVDERLRAILERYDYTLPYVEYHTFVKYHLKGIIRRLAEACPANLMKCVPTTLTATEKKMEANWVTMRAMASAKKPMSHKEHEMYEYQKKIAEAHGTANTDSLWQRDEEGRAMKYNYELISSHCARRTFTTLAIKNPALTDDEIMSITGHKNIYNYKKYDLTGKAWKATEVAKKLGKKNTDITDKTYKIG